MNLNEFHVAFDCDSTLIHGPDDVDSKGNSMEGVPRYSAIDLYRALEALGATLWVWSNKGLGHAEEVRATLGLSAKAAEKGSFKPDIAIDDEDFTLGKISIDINGNNEHLMAAFDVHNTLLHDSSPEFLDNEGNPLIDVPRYSVIYLYHLLDFLGLNMIIWSSHGEEIAESCQNKLGLPGTPMAKDKLLRPDLGVDNHDFDLAKVTLKV